MGKNGGGGGEDKVERKRIYTLVYTDDSIIGEDEDEMRSMIDKLEEYMERGKGWS